MTKRKGIFKKRSGGPGRGKIGLAVSSNLIIEHSNVVDDIVLEHPSSSDNVSVGDKSATEVSMQKDSKIDLSLFDEFDSNISNECGNVIISLDILNKILFDNTKCKYCDSSDCLSCFENDNRRVGLCSNLSIYCKRCKITCSFYTSPKSSSCDLYDINIRTVYGLRDIGKGQAAGKTLFSIMNLPSPPTKFEKYIEELGPAVKATAEVYMKKAVNEAIEYNDNNTDISVALDGSWQKRGHTSLNGVVTVTSVDTCKVIDIQCLTKYCHLCSISKGECSRPHQCKNFDGPSGGMEAKGAVMLFERSENTRGVRYLEYLGDGDSKGYQSVSAAKPYGDSVEIKKLECIAHVQKRMGTRLRKLITANKGKKLDDGKKIGGKGRLTKLEIDNLQLYYGMAIRRNTDSLENMRKDVLATYFHKVSTDQNPNHGLCPKGNESWCKFNRSLITGEIYNHKHSLPESVAKEIKSIFRDLSKPDLLRKCLHGRTQNPNESVNSVIWQKLPKTGFVGVKVFELGAYDAIIQFNVGSIGKLKVLEEIGLKCGKNTVKGLRNIDAERLTKSENIDNILKKKSRGDKRKRKMAEEEDQELRNPSYGAGMFD